MTLDVQEGKEKKESEREKKGLYCEDCERTSDRAPRILFTRRVLGIHEK